MHLPSWKHRRRIVYASLIYCAVVLAYIVLKGADTALYSQVALGILGLAATIIGTYVFGAAWDDRNVMRYGEQNPPPQPPTPPEDWPHDGQGYR